MRRKPHAHKQIRLDSQDLDFLASIRLRVIDPDLKHGKTFLQFFSTCPGPVFGCKFGFESAVHFKGVTRGRQFTVAATILFLLYSEVVEIDGLA